MASPTLADPEIESAEPLNPGVDAGPNEHYEIVDDLVVEEPPLGAREVWIASEIAESFVLFKGERRLGKMYEEMLFVLKDEPRLRRRPGLAFVSAERWPVSRPAPAAAAWNVVPDLAVEIVSPTDLIDDVMSKIEEYFRAGVRLVWVIYPSVQKLYSYDSPRSVQILAAGDTVGGGAVLPGFAMPLGRIFVADEPEPGTAAT